MFDESGNNEQGFTLIELLIAVMVSGLILSALAMGFIAAMRGTAGAHDRFVASNGSQTFATYFTSDVQSANPASVSTSAAAFGCSTTPALPAGSTNVIQMQWTEMTTATKMTAFNVSYRTEPYGSEWQLKRYFCSATQEPVTDPASTILGAATPSTHVMATALSSPTLTKSLSDAVTTAGSATITSASAEFSTADIGQSITGAGIQPNTTIADVVSSTQARLSSNATGTSPSVTLNRYALATVSGRQIAMSLYANPSSGQPQYGYRLTASMRTPTLVPLVTSINRYTGDPNPTNASTVRWSVVFSEDVTGVDASDFNLSSSITQITTTDNQTYTVTASTGSDGTLGLNLVDNDTILDTPDSNKLGGAGANNGDFTGQTYTVDKTAPTSVTVDRASGQADPTSTQPVVFHVHFSEAVTGFDATDVTKGGTTSGGTVTVTGLGQDYDISISGLSGTGTVTVSIPAGAAQDAAGNLSPLPTYTDNSVQFNGPPTITGITRAGTSPTGAQTVKWNVTYSGSVTGVTAADFQLVPGGGVSGASITNVAGSGANWTVTADRGSGYGTLGLNAADGSVTGAVYTISAFGGISSSNAGSGGTKTGQLDQNDKIVVTFSTDMDPSSICSAWTTSGNQAATNVVVNVTENGANDTLSLSSLSSSCPTLQFGTIALGASYVKNGNMTFGASGTASTIAWNATNKTLTITLGNANSPSGGGQVDSQVTSSTVTATYTPSSSIKYSSGAGGSAIGTTSVSVTGPLF